LAGWGFHYSNFESNGFRPIFTEFYQIRPIFLKTGGSRFFSQHYLDVESQEGSGSNHEKDFGIWHGRRKTLGESHDEAHIITWFGTEEASTSAALTRPSKVRVKDGIGVGSRKADDRDGLRE
jgi:hypothetical protein